MSVEIFVAAIWYFTARITPIVQVKKLFQLFIMRGHCAQLPKATLSATVSLKFL
jgi:hypothetical protein